MKPVTSSRTRHVTVFVLTVALLTVAFAPVHAQRRAVRATTHTSLNQNRNTNVNVNRNTNVNVNVNNRGGYYNHGPSVAGVVAASVATAIVVGAIVNSLPPNCTTLVVNGLAYQNCGGTYYQPQYQGNSVSYVVVVHP